MIFKKVGFEGYRGPQDATLKVEISVPTQQVGRIIGKGGSTVSVKNVLPCVIVSILGALILYMKTHLLTLIAVSDSKQFVGIFFAGIKYINFV